jgi:D-beta-D-heptose 7-phosphate kinase/D-beta-D-heptose 1-phosphate adenosyltransferase
MKNINSKFKKIISGFSKLNILVLGDLILDHYIIGKVDRISPEAPVPVLWARKEKFVCGGSANVGLNIVSLGAKAGVCGVLGADHFGKTLYSLIEQGGINTGMVIKDRSRPTTIKTRIMAGHQQVVRVDWESIEPLTMEVNKAFLDKLRKNIDKFDAVIIEDYGKGVINPALLEEAVGLCKKKGKIITVDPKEEHFDYYENVTSLTPNLKEAEAAGGMKIKDKKEIPLLGEVIMEKLHPKSLLITLGEDGMMVFHDGKCDHIPTAAQEVFDVSGAGDTVIATFTLALAAGADYLEAAQIANFAAGIVVGKLGTAVTNKKELFDKINKTIKK